MECLTPSNVLSGNYYRECKMKLCEIESVYNYMKIQFVCADLMIDGAVVDADGHHQSQIEGYGGDVGQLRQSVGEIGPIGPSDLFVETILQLYVAVGQWMTEKQEQMLTLLLLACSK